MLTRVVNIYALNWSHHPAPLTGTPARRRWRRRSAGQGEADHPTVPVKKWLSLGDLNAFYESNSEQLPRLLFADTVTVTVTDPDRRNQAINDLEVTRARTFLFALPSYQVVLAVELTFEGGVIGAAGTARTAAALDSGIGEGIMIGERRLDEYAALLAEQVRAEVITPTASALLPERHLLVFAPRHTDPRDAPDSKTIDRIIYRARPPYRAEFIEKKTPDPLNFETEKGPTQGVITPYASLIYGHEVFVEDSIFLSTVQAVGTAARFRQIWHDSYRQVRKFREEKQRKGKGLQRREDLEELADSLGNLEFDLTFSVEFPLMRIESFHSALYSAMDLPTQAVVLSRMFTQLADSLRSEITAIEARERKQEEQRQRWNSAAISLLSLMGLPAGIVLTFLGINAVEVDQHISMANSKYFPLYVVAFALALLPSALLIWPHWSSWHNRETRHPKLWLATGLVLLAVGALTCRWAVVRYMPDVEIDFDDALYAVGGLLLATVGLAGVFKGIKWLRFREE